MNPPSAGSDPRPPADPLRPPAAREAGSGPVRALPFLLACVAYALAGCDGGPEPDPSAASPDDALRSRLMDPAATPDVRIERILAEARPANLAAVPALIRVIKDKSHVSFLLKADPEHPLGFAAVEFQETGEDRFAMERVAAVCALEKTGATLPLPDLLLALDDRNPIVSNHAARALVRLGNRAGIECLLLHLEGRAFPGGEDLKSPAFAGETAHEILKEVSGEDLGFNADSGLAGKMESAARWRKWWEGVQASGGKLATEGRAYQEGQDGETDRRIRFHVDMLGQFQTLYHEQARKALIRLGVPALSFLRTGVESALASGNATALGGIAQVLARIRHANGRQLLEDVLRRAPPAARTRAAEALGSHGGREAVAALAAAAARTDQDPSVRLAAVAGLGAAGGEEAAAALRSFDSGQDAELARARRIAIFEATRGAEEREEVLALLLADSLPARNAAHAVLVKVTGKTADYDPLAEAPARQAAVEAYRRLLGPR